MEPAHYMDFEGWRRLAEDDPEGFERQRRATIDAAIDQAPGEQRDRLRRLQWRIDQVRERSSSPLAACVRLSNMMWERIYGKHGLLQVLEEGKPPEEEGRSRVVALHPRRRRRTDA
ncbi:MAG TPA: DUF3135 domain-containing protein [Gammaproteobacteria bacterium]|nr:DUF3135 domain-containing protein [Gammaproteobacteria bacterium]